MEEIIKLAEKGNFQVRHFETWQEYNIWKIQQNAYFKMEM